MYSLAMWVFLFTMLLSTAIAEVRVGYNDCAMELAEDGKARCTSNRIVLSSHSTETGDLILQNDLTTDNTSSIQINCHYIMHEQLAVRINGPSIFSCVPDEGTCSTKLILQALKSPYIYKVSLTNASGEGVTTRFSCLAKVQ